MDAYMAHFYCPSLIKLTIDNLKTERGQVKYFEEMSFYVALCRFISHLFVAYKITQSAQEGLIYLHALRIDFEQLQVETRSDYEERTSIRKKAISLFNSNSQALYEAPGKLIIDIGPTGFKFNVDIERSASQGIESMKVFCFDLMLAQLWPEKENNPGFLVHDSTIFDGVDERQVAHAIQLAEKEANKYNFQYICCLNSDLVPWDEFGEGFNLRDYVCVELTDAREDGGILGIRF